MNLVYDDERIIFFNSLSILRFHWPLYFMGNTIKLKEIDVVIDKNGYSKIAAYGPLAYLIFGNQCAV